MFSSVHGGLENGTLVIDDGSDAGIASEVDVGDHNENTCSSSASFCSRSNKADNVMIHC